MPTKKLLLFATLALIVVGLVTRFAGNNFDRGLHFHPDERWLMMVEDRLHLFDRLDPDFYAYGSLPLYLLKGIGQVHDHFFHIKMNNYDGLLYLGRYFTSMLDIGVIGLVGMIAWRLTQDKKTAVFASLSYALMFFPIQNSNFFTVDTFVNVSVSLILLGLVSYLRTKKSIWLFLTFIMMGSALASKVTPVIIIMPTMLYLVLLPFFVSNKKSWFQKLLNSCLIGISGLIITASIFSFAMPYAVIKSQRFIKEVRTQLEMNKDAYVFPYTLQYVGTTPYLYYLKNIFIYGAGPILSVMAIGGLLISLKSIFKAIKPKFHTGDWLRNLFISPTVVYLSLNLIYFLIIGRSAVKFMRYMLPLYPALAILAGIGFVWILKQERFNWQLRRIIVISLLIICTWWTIGFMQIYVKPHPRIIASDWMKTYILAGSTIAVEHWDDRMPIYGSEKFNFVELPLYEVPDNQAKWQLVNSYLAKADYIVLASNRLSTPLPKLADCTKWKKCYPLTSQYYDQLFAGQLGYKEVARFNSFPKFWTPLGSFELNDQGADESFTVYDHPQVIVFKRK